MSNGVVKGIKEMERRMKSISRQQPVRMQRAMKQEAEAIMTRSKKEFVPVNLGTLRSSGYVNDPVVGSDGSISVNMGYGGAAEAYALAVHETPSEHDPASWQGVNVQFSPSGHGPKYLEKPLMEAIPELPKKIAERLQLDLLKVD